MNIKEKYEKVSDILGEFGNDVYDYDFPNVQDGLLKIHTTYVERIMKVFEKEEDIGSSVIGEGGEENCCSEREGGG